MSTRKPTLSPLQSDVVRELAALTNPRDLALAVDWLRYHTTGTGEPVSLDGAQHLDKVTTVLRRVRNLLASAEGWEGALQHVTGTPPLRMPPMLMGTGKATSGTASVWHDPAFVARSDAQEGARRSEQAYRKARTGARP